MVKLPNILDQMTNDGWLYIAFIFGIVVTEVLEYGLSTDVMKCTLKIT